MSGFINKILATISVLSILSQPLFFSGMGLMGLDYEGVDSSPIYIIFITTIFILSFLSYLYSCFKRGIIKQETPILVIIILLLLIHFVWVIVDPIKTELLPRSLLLFVSLGLPGVFSALTVIKLKLLKLTVKITEVILLIIAIGIFYSAVIPTLSGSLTNSLAGASYQSLSYYSALTFGGLLNYKNIIPSYLRFSWCSNFWYNLVLSIFIITSLVGTLLGGGRGASILLITYIFIYLISIIKSPGFKDKKAKLITMFLRISSLIFILIVFAILFWDMEFIQSGFKRATQFISSDGGVDLAEGSSGRDTVYSTALQYIYDKPLIGYGPFGALDKTIQAHNIFLDILLQLGIIGLLLSTIYFFILSIRAINNRTEYSQWAFILFLYPIIMLMFSGVYFHTALFNFGFVFFMVYRKV